jgi:hypothetical protein
MKDCVCPVKDLRLGTLYGILKVALESHVRRSSPNHMRNGEQNSAKGQIPHPPNGYLSFSPFHLWNIVKMTVFTHG